jgi:hypothetical protein
MRGGLSQKPPVHTRFKKGQSGNPRGRPVKKPAGVARRALNENVTLTENGKRRRVTKPEAVIAQLVNKPASAELCATKMLIYMLREGQCSEPGWLFGDLPVPAADEQLEIVGSPPRLREPQRDQLELGVVVGSPGACGVGVCRATGSEPGARRDQGARGRAGSSPGQPAGADGAVALCDDRRGGLRALLIRLSRGAAAKATARRALRALSGFAKALKFKYDDLQIGLEFEPEPGLAAAAISRPI